MYFYDAFIAAGIAAVVLAVILITVRHKRSSPIPIVCFAAAAALLCLTLWNTRTDRSLALYDTMMSSDKLTVIGSEESRELSFAYSGDHVLTGLDKAPTFVKEADVERLYELVFTRSDTGAHVKLTLCLLRSTKGCPESTYFTKDGRQYCFINESFPYVRAMYVPNNDLANTILDAVL